MIFKRTSRLKTTLSLDEVKDRLSRKQFKVHDMDFEIAEKERMLKVIPHAEHIQSIKTLPITHVDVQGNGATGSRIVLTSKPRRIDVGGPYLIVIFCLFCIVGASIFYFINPDESFMPPLTMAGVGILIFIVFWIRMESGYFDYVRKIREYIKGVVK